MPRRSVAWKCPEQPSLSCCRTGGCHAPPRSFRDPVPIEEHHRHHDDACVHNVGDTSNTDNHLSISDSQPRRDSDHIMAHSLSVSVAKI